MRRLTPLLALCISAAACAKSVPSTMVDDANAGIDSLNARLVQVYRTSDSQRYAQLYTDSAVFEWPAFNSVRGHAALTAMARENWAALRDMDLKLTVASRRVTTNQATEFGAFEQSWNDSAGVRMTEYGRYVTALTRGNDGIWRIDRFFGFEDSVRSAARR